MSEPSRQYDCASEAERKRDALPSYLHRITCMQIPVRYILLLSTPPLQTATTSQVTREDSLSAHATNIIVTLDYDEPPEPRSEEPEREAN